MTPLKVAIIIETSTQYGRNLLSGFARYARNQGWELFFEQRGKALPEPDWLRDWEGDGIITAAADQRWSREHAKRGVSVLDIFEGPQGLPIDSDHEAVGRMAADYFLAKGFSRFAFAGFKNLLYSLGRERGFAERLKEAGFSYHRMLRDGEQAASYADSHTKEIEFLKSLENPCALFVAYDQLATQLLNTCEECGISVPEDVAVLGVDNDSLLCGLARPPLSSIDPNISELGQRIAAFLHAMMEGMQSHEIDLNPTVMPASLEERQSTSVDAVQDEMVAKALRYIRKEACAGLTIEGLAKKCSMSRRTLERRIQSALHRTVRSLLVETQLLRVRQLLLESDFTLAHIADEVGIRHPERLSHLFKRELGMTPGEFRRRNRR